MAEDSPANPEPAPLPVVAAVIVREGRVLICQRRATDAFPLKWEFPGGKVQAGESVEAALARELHEELGVVAAIGARLFQTRHHYAGQPRAVELTFFSAAFDGPPENLAFERIEWAQPAALRCFDFLEADLEFIAQFVAGKIQS